MPLQKQEAKRPRVTPTSIGSGRPVSSGTFVPPRAFAWSASSEARFYLARLFRDGQKVFRDRTAKPKVTLPAALTFTPGLYRWQVLPVFRSRGQIRTGRPIVDSTFVCQPIPLRVPCATPRCRSELTVQATIRCRYE
jgi:hypothetical protein